MSNEHSKAYQRILSGVIGLVAGVFGVVLSISNCSTQQRVKELETREQIRNESMQRTITHLETLLDEVREDLKQTKDRMDKRFDSLHDLHFKHLEINHGAASASAAPKTGAAPAAPAQKPAGKPASSFKDIF